MTNTLNCVITGPTNGIGKQTAIELAAKGFSLVLLCRDVDKGNALVQELQKLSNVDHLVVECDLSSLVSVRGAAAQLNAQLDHIDVLINNAGIVSSSRQLSVDGHELMFATNHLGPFLLTNLVLDKVKNATKGRIINVASAAHVLAKGIRFDDLEWNSGFTTSGTYGHSKLCNILMTLSLSQMLKDDNVVVNSLHPGAVSTNLGTQNGAFAKFVFNIARPFFRTVEKGAKTSVWLASDEGAGQYNNKYFYDCKAIQAKPWAQDSEAAQDLWEVSAKLTNLHGEA